MLKYLLMVCTLTVCSNSYRLLGYFPITGKSEHNIFQPILHELAKRGHQVVYVTTIRPDFSHPNLQVRLIEPFQQIYTKYYALEKCGEYSILWQKYYEHMLGWLSADYFYGNSVTQELVHGNETFDAVLLESFWLQEPASALLHRFNCPAIEIETFGDSAYQNELAGLSDNPSYQIDLYTWLTDEMCFTERIHNTYVSLSALVIGYYHLWMMQQVMDKYFNYTGWESRPSIYKLVTNRSIILVNQDVALDYAYPVAPHVKRIGGVNVQPNKPLPADIQKFMDEASEGVVYFSFGSNLKTSELLKSDYGKTFFSVLEKLPQKILMKWEEDAKIKLPNNVMTYKWIPQQDVLNHTNCKLFISHGGYLSISEAAYHGVPVLGVPFFGDQPKNVIAVQKRGNALLLTKENITVESVSWAIRELLNNPRYKNAAKEISQIIRSRRQTPLEDSMYWIEFAIKYPNFLTPRSAKLSFVQLHMLDIKLFMLLSIYVLYKSIKLLLRFIYFKKDMKKKIE